MPRTAKKLSPLALEFMAWDQTPSHERDPATQMIWCEVHDVPLNYPSRWKKSAAWEKALASRAWEQDDDDDEVDLTSSEVVEALRLAALSGDVAAANTYLKYQAQLQAPDDDDIRGMSDAELADALEAAAADIRERPAFPQD